jgi:hypothetical protein
MLLHTRPEKGGRAVRGSLGHAILGGYEEELDMQPATTTRTDPDAFPSSEVTILSKVFLRSPHSLTKEQARYLVELGFSDEDKERMKGLARKNREGEISTEELRELDSYVKAGDLLAILQSKARKILKAK